MNQKIVIYILIILAMAAGTFYFSKYSKMMQQNQVKTPVTQTSTISTYNNNVNPAAPVKTTTTQIYNISIANLSFAPNTIHINKGDTIAWTNNDSVPHQIKGDTLSSLSGPAMSNGQVYSYTFNDAGTFNYHCAIHPSMKGKIIVK